MPSDIVILLIVAFVLLVIVGYLAEVPFVYVVAGMVALFAGVQAYNDTSSVYVGISFGTLGVVTLLGGLNEALNG